MARTTIKSQDIAAGAITLNHLASAVTSVISTPVDDEIPAGVINGVNATFTLANAPIAGSQHLYKNGIRQTPGAGNDYTIAGATITFLAGNIPQTGDNLLADYRR